jgi:glutamate 5-kinase
VKARLAKAKRIVVKIGSALLVDDKTGTIKASWLSSLIDDLADARVRGAEIIIVSSGAIALGPAHAGACQGGTLKLEQKQAAAAVGQIALAQAWTEALRTRNMVAAQVLVTLTTRRSAAATSMRGRHFQPCSNRARCPSSTRTTRWRRAKSAMATMTGWPRASPP